MMIVYDDDSPISTYNINVPLDEYLKILNGSKFKNMHLKTEDNILYIYLGSRTTYLALRQKDAYFIEEQIEKTFRKF